MANSDTDMQTWHRYANMSFAYILVKYTNILSTFRAVCRTRIQKCFQYSNFHKLHSSVLTNNFMEKDSSHWNLKTIIKLKQEREQEWLQIYRWMDDVHSPEIWSAVDVLFGHRHKTQQITDNGISISVWNYKSVCKYHWKDECLSVYPGAFLITVTTGQVRQWVWTQKTRRTSQGGKKRRLMLHISVKNIITTASAAEGPYFWVKGNFNGHLMNQL